MRPYTKAMVNSACIALVYSHFNVEHLHQMYLDV